MTIIAQGVADGSHGLFVFVDRTGGPCYQTPYDENFATALSSANGDPVAAGSFTKTYSYTPATAGTYTICSYLDAKSYTASDAIGAGRFTVGSGASIIAASPTDGGSEFGTPVTVSFVVNSVVGPTAANAIYFSTDRGELTGDSNSGGVSVTPRPGATWGPGSHTVALPITSPGIYYWAVDGQDRNGVDIDTGIHTFVVAPAAPTHLLVRVSQQNATWSNSGSATLHVSTNSWESLAITLAQHGRKLTTLNKPANLNGDATAAWQLSCPSSSTFQVTVVATDGRGDHVARRVSFRPRSCGPRPKPHYGSVISPQEQAADNEGIRYMVQLAVDEQATSYENHGCSRVGSRQWECAFDIFPDQRRACLTHIIIDFASRTSTRIVNVETYGLTVCRP